MSKNQYAKKLSERGPLYDKADRDFYEKVTANQETAIRNAKRLERPWNDAGSEFPQRKIPLRMCISSLNFETGLRALERLPERFASFRQ